jgi:hypothetical protein
MCNLSHWITLLFTISAGAGYSSYCAAQSRKAPSPVSLRRSVEGSFAHYLESPNGDIDGIVLEDGTVARFPPLMCTTLAGPFRPGDSLRVEGDNVSGLIGPYLVHALVTRSSVPMSRGSPPAQTKGGSAAGNPSPRIDKNGFVRAKGARESSGRPPGGTGKTPSRSAVHPTRVDEILVAKGASPRGRRQGRLEMVKSKARAATTGTEKSGSDSPWDRSQETAGP